MKIKFECEPKEALRYNLYIKGPVEEYAKNLLILINNARCYPNSIYKVENTDVNNVYITCPKDGKAVTKDWLEEYGEIEAIEKVYVFEPKMVYTPETNKYLMSLDAEYEPLMSIID